MNKLSTEKRIAVVRALAEGCSIRSTVRMTGVAKNTVTKLLVDLGRACWQYQSKVLRNLSSKRVQCDEIWSFCYAKEKNVPAEKRGTFGYGDVWTWTAIDADTKLAISWMVGKRDSGTAQDFIADVSLRLANRVQLTTDGLKVYLEAVEAAFGGDIDFAQLVKVYGPSGEGPEARYSPPACVGCNAKLVSGRPDWKHVSTSFVERQNLTMRMQMRRFTRLTNAFSKKVENLECAVALHFMVYNFARVHQTLRVTPAMAAGVTRRLWGVADIVALLDGIPAN
ncbi:MAG: IS1 family transposase [Planctomycetaceae bacterium]